MHPDFIVPLSSEHLKAHRQNDREREQLGETGSQIFLDVGMISQVLQTHIDGDAQQTEEACSSTRTFPFLWTSAQQMSLPELEMQLMIT